MTIVFAITTLLAAGANAYGGYADLSRADWILANMKRLNVPEGWLFRLGALKLAGALGLLVGLGLPLIGIAAATGLVLFFVGAIVAVVRAGWYGHLPVPSTFLVLALGALALRLATL